MTEAADTSHSAPPEMVPPRRRESGKARSGRSVAVQKPRRGAGKNLAKAKPAGRSAILTAILSFPARVIATATLCVTLIAAGRFILTVVRKAL